jgi:hypothetical protein
MSPPVQPNIQADTLIRDAIVSKYGPNPTVNCDIFGLTYWWTLWSWFNIITRQ